MAVGLQVGGGTVPASAAWIVARWSGADGGGQVGGRAADGADDLLVGGSVEGGAEALDLCAGRGVSGCRQPHRAADVAALLGAGKVDFCVAYTASGCLDAIG